MKITVLVDNAVPMGQTPLVGEHGLALLVETGNKKILVDTGQSAAVVANMVLLGHHPAQLDAVTISHGHFDHTGGLVAVLRHARKPLPVYAHPNLFHPRYWQGADGKRSYIGLPFPKAEADSLGAEWVLTAQPREILPGLWFSGEIPRQTPFETIDPGFVTLHADGTCRHDPIADDTVLYHAGEQGLTVISGCAHAGLVNAVRHGLAVTGLIRLHGWVGGTHLGPAGGEQRQATLDALGALDPEFVAANHCTGIEIMGELRARFGKKFVAALTGTVLEL